ncbi:uncharacterized protein LOC107620931 [Arachis ipaensis]|uniref:uncharacterized protein LOC107620931 n=1 Tax=Arachis ipaensis TaxID=130454 RepID=UPI0007AF9B40|nr:uncharacterized protein LOC107620931 [Arachis ipaensis]XP_025685389.1 uncharacterized protein LOC112786201 [Arachis hypogaea]
MTETRSSIRNLELQIGQLSKRIPEISSSIFPSNTEVNLREECKALTIEADAESEKELLALNANKGVAGHSCWRSTPKEEQVVALNATIEEDGCSTPTKDSHIEEPREIRAHQETIEVPLNALLQIMEFEEYFSSDEEEETREEKIARYLGTLMKLHAKFCETEALKEEPPVFTQECSVLVQKKLPQKKPDPESFLISCTIGTITFEKDLCNLGSSINLMPLSVMRRLGILEV